MDPSDSHSLKGDLKDETKAVGKATGLMTVAVAFSRVTGYLRIFALAYALGVGLRSTTPDAYNLANVMPNMFYELLAGAILASVLIPMFTKHLVSNEKVEAWGLVNTITNLALVVLGSIVILAIFFPAPFVYTQTFLAQGTAPIDEITFFFRVFAPQIVFYALAAIYSAILFSHKKFLVPTIAPVLNNIVVIFTVMVLYIPVSESDPQLGLWILALGTTLGVVVMTMVLLPSVLKLGLKYRPVINLKHPSIAKFGALSLPVLGFVILNQIGLTALINIAVQFPGGVSAYIYAMPLFQLTYAVLSYPISNALFPYLSEHAAKENMPAFREQVSLGVRTIGYLLIPATLLVFVLSTPLVRVLLEHGVFGSEAGATALTAAMLQGLALGIFSFSLWMFVTKGFYALHDTITPMWVTGVGTVVLVGLLFLFVAMFGVTGIGYAVAAQHLIASTLLLYMLRRKLGTIDGHAIFRSLTGQSIAAIAAGALAWIVSTGMVGLLGSDQLVYQVLEVTASIFTAIVTYLVITRLLNLPELTFVAGFVPGLGRLVGLKTAA